MPFPQQSPINVYGQPGARPLQQGVGIGPIGQFARPTLNQRPPTMQTQGTPAYPPTYPAPSFVPQQQAQNRQTNFQPTFQPATAMPAINQNVPSLLSSQNAATVVKALSQGGQGGQRMNRGTV